MSAPESIQNDSVEEELSAYLDGELDAESVRKVERRLARDGSYQLELQRLERAWRLLDDLPRATVDESFTKSTIEMVAVAEESNTLETVLTDIADTLERQTWRRLDLMVRLIEPVMLLVMASIVLVVVLALLLPVMKMSMAV